MIIKQFYDKALAHASYIIISDNKAMVIDPARDPQIYYMYANANMATIVGVIETHPHADFVSSHLQIAQEAGATIYTSKLTGAEYPHQTFDEGDTIQLGKVSFRAINTPGHSPDSISVVVVNEAGQDYAVFTGDTLFIGDVGRPDLRENVGNIQETRATLARQMYHSTREKLMKLAPEVIVYPTHGAGSLCGKNLSEDRQSTIGKELKENPALQTMSEEDFVAMLLEGQPFIPKYFSHAVIMNKVGADNLRAAIGKIPRLVPNETLQEEVVLIDARPQTKFKEGHLKGAINIQNGGKFETWLGSIVAPTEPFYLIVENTYQADALVNKVAKIGYEKNIKGIIVNMPSPTANSLATDVDHFLANEAEYTIIDIRNTSERDKQNFFENSLHIPLPELRERVGEIPMDKPIIVHCAGGYRSAAGSSIIESSLPNEVKVYDLSIAIQAISAQKAAGNN